MRAIITADWHLREDKPLCRTDEDWFITQQKCIQFVISMANQRDADLWIIGDLFHRPVVSPKIVNLFLKEIKCLSGDCWILPGNHDMQYGNYENILNSSIGTVLSSGLVTELGEDKFYNSGTGLSSPLSKTKCFHKLVFEKGTDIPPGCDGILATQLIKDNPEADYIFTGDNHKSFLFDYKDCILINSGCLIRQSANEIDYKPCFYFLDTNYQDIEDIEEIDSLDNEYDKFLTSSHIKDKNERDNRIEAFAEKLKNNEGISLSFEDNLRNELKNNSIKDGTKKVVEELLEVCL